MGRYFKVLLLGIFLLAVILIVVLQFNSDRSIDELISGNETLLEELQVRNDLLVLQTGITSLESKVRGLVISGADMDSSSVSRESAVIRSALSKLKVLEDDQAIRPLLKDLYRQSEAKINFNLEVIRIYNTEGKAAAEELVNTKLGNRLTDSIRFTTARIHDVHELLVTDLIKSADTNGERAKALGVIMAVIASIAAIFSFGYVSYKNSQQQQLINKLNISERKAKEAVQVKENFMANMSHEIRTPMNAILGFTDLLLQENIEPRLQDHVRTIHRSGESLLSIINDILDLSRMEAGMMKIDNVPFHLEEVIRNAEKLFSARAAEKGIKLIVHISPSLAEDVVGDATRLSQVLVNLVGNAIKFTDQGEVRLLAESSPTGANKVNVLLRVEDTGIGMDPAQLRYIFERFRQADGQVNRRYGGTGLGLSIVKDLVELMGGMINVESAPGKGTVFNIVLPYTVSAEKVAAVQDADAVFQFEPLALTVLVAEDNTINQNLVRQLLGRWKIKYDIAEDGQEVISMLKQQPYDLVLMDIQMPGMDGYATTSMIREELGMDIPVIAMTAHALEGEREKCLAAGMNDYISKPLRQRSLYEVLHKYARGRDIEGFSEIQLDYMREVSGGDLAYERLVTTQFIEALPEEIAALEQAFHEGNHTKGKQLAHNLKTTISVMGLNEQWGPLLDALEYELPEKTKMEEILSLLREKSNIALNEARRLLGQLNARS